MTQEKNPVRVPELAVQPPFPPASLDGRMQQNIGLPKSASRSALAGKHRNRATHALNAAYKLSQKEGALTAAERMRLAGNAWSAVAHTVRSVTALHGWGTRKAEAVQTLLSSMDEGDFKILDKQALLRRSGEHRYGDPLTQETARGAPIVAAELMEMIWEAAPRLNERARPEGFFALERDAPPRPRRRPPKPIPRDYAQGAFPSPDE